MRNPIGFLRVVGLIEGLSLLILLFIAMPLKYGAGIPEVVSIVGMIHGVLFVLYIFVVFYVTIEIRWSIRWIVGSLVVSFIPFGNFILDRNLRKLKTNDNSQKYKNVS